MAGLYDVTAEGVDFNYQINLLIMAFWGHIVDGDNGNGYNAQEARDVIADWIADEGDPGIPAFTGDILTDFNAILAEIQAQPNSASRSMYALQIWFAFQGNERGNLVLRPGDTVVEDTFRNILNIPYPV